MSKVPAEKKPGLKKGDFKQFDLESKEGPGLGAPPVGPDKETAAKMLAEKNAAHKNIGSSQTGDSKAPIIRNPASEVDISQIATPVDVVEVSTPAKPLEGDDSRVLVRPKSASKPKSLRREDTTQFEKEQIDEAAIHQYALNDEYSLLERLIGLRALKTDQGKNNIRFLDCRDKHGNTALMNACWKGNTFIAEFLLKSGASKDLQNYYGWTAMHWAVANNRVATVKLLIEWDVNLRILTPVDRPPLDFADNEEIRKLLEDVLNKPMLLLGHGGKM